MQTAILEVLHCPDNNMFGLMQEGFDLRNDFDDITIAVTGQNIAHDVLEHINGPYRIGTVEDELEALGALYWIRGQTGTLTREKQYYTAEQNIAFDISNMMRMIDDLQDVPVTDAGQFEEAFDKILKISLKDYLDEAEFDEYSEREINPDQWISKARHFLRNGLLKAQEKIPDENVANCLFWNIADETTKALKYAEYEGQKFELKYCTTTGNVTCFEVEPEWDEEE